MGVWKFGSLTFYLHLFSSVITPTFSAGKMKRMKPSMDDTIRTLIANFEDSLKSSSKLDIKNISGAFTMDT